MKMFFKILIGTMCAIITLLILFVIKELFKIKSEGYIFFMGWVSCTAYGLGVKMFDNWSKERKDER